MNFNFGEKAFSDSICPTCRFVGNWIGLDAYVCGNEKIVLQVGDGPHNQRTYSIPDLAELFSSFADPALVRTPRQITPEIIAAFLSVNIAGLIKKMEGTKNV